MEGKRGGGSRWLLLLLLLPLPVIFGAIVLVWLLDQSPQVTEGSGASVTSVDAFGQHVKAWQVAAAVAVGTGGLITLGTVFHRQSVQARAAADARFDADEKRAQELFVKAVEQLGHERAAVRIGALHALDALGQEHTHRRRAVLDVWCAYLRMPPENPERFTTETVQEAAPPWHSDELQVRTTCQRLIADHLRPAPIHGRRRKAAVSAERFWGDMDIDLNGAFLHRADFGSCRFRETRFDEATFTGATTFAGAEFSKTAVFSQALFSGEADFSGVVVHGAGEFRDSMFGAGASFDLANFREAAGMVAARFAAEATFTETVFTGKASLAHARFGGRASFGRARFVSHGDFTDALFARDVMFDGAEFAEGAVFRAARFRGHSGFGVVRFRAEAWFAKTRFDADVGFGGARFAGDAYFESTVFTGAADFGRSRFAKDAVFTEACFRSHHDFAAAVCEGSARFRDARTANGHGEPFSPP